MKPFFLSLPPPYLSLSLSILTIYLYLHIYIFLYLYHSFSISLSRPLMRAHTQTHNKPEFSGGTVDVFKLEPGRVGARDK